MTNNKINNAKITSIAIASILLIGSLSMTNTVFAHSQNTVITFGNNGPVIEGTPGVLSGIATALEKTGPPHSHLAAPVDGGIVTIYQGFNADDSVAMSCPPDHWVPIDEVSTDNTGHYESEFATFGLGGQTLVFYSHLATLPTVYSASDSDCVPLVINETAECEGDIQIAAIDSSVDAENGIFGYTIKVTACTEVEDIKIQGGSNGWSNITSFIGNPAIGDIDEREKKRNTVYSWTIDELAANDMVTFEVVLTPKENKDISCGETVQINGAWSVAYKLPEDNTKYKTEYTSPLTWTNECPPV